MPSACGSSTSRVRLDAMVSSSNAGLCSCAVMVCAFRAPLSGFGWLQLPGVSQVEFEGKNHEDQLAHFQPLQYYPSLAPSVLSPRRECVAERVKT